MSKLLEKMKVIYTEIATQIEDPITVGQITPNSKAFDLNRPIETFRQLTLASGKAALSPEEFEELKKFLPSDFKVLPKTKLEIREETRFGKG